MGMKIRSAFLVVAGYRLLDIPVHEHSDLERNVRSSSTSRTLPPLSCGRTSSSSNSDAWSGGGVTTQGASGIGDRVFDETVEFSRRSAWLLQSAIRLHASFTPWWITYQGNDVTFNQDEQEGMDTSERAAGNFDRQRNRKGSSLSDRSLPDTSANTHSASPRSTR